MIGCYRQGISEAWSAVDWALMTREQRAELSRQVMAATAKCEAEQRRQWANNAQRMARRAELQASVMTPANTSSFDRRHPSARARATLH